MRRVASSVLFGGLVSLLSGCPAPTPEPPLTPTPGIDFPTPDGGRPGIGSFFMDPRIDNPGTAPADAPPPISGGTLHLLQSARAVVVADPDRDRILVVDLSARRVMGETTHLPPGAEPGRIAEDAAGRVHVVLRGTGELYSFDLEAVDAGERRAACAMPRGVAYDAASDQLHVACRGGELVSFAAAGGEALRTVQLERDLRDVVVQGSRLFVSRFRSAELVEIDATGAAMGTRLPVPAFGFRTDGGSGGFDPAVAWRTISAPASEEIAMVHQRASGQEVAPDPGGYGGGGSGCESSIVQSSVTFFGPDGGVTEGPDLGRATLPVDVAISPMLPDGRQRVAVVAAGNERGESSVLIWDKQSLQLSGAGACVFPEEQNTVPIPNATSAVYTQEGTLVVLSRDADIEGRSGAHLALLDVRGATTWIHLGGETRFDAGHAVFHGNSGAFLACASCHPEGGEDGRIWTFGRIGARRTPAMHGDLIGTEPFHWDGDMANLEHLVRDVLTGRMQGPELDRIQVDALGGWLDALPPPVNGPTADHDAVARGATLFYGEGQCASCHSGPLYSNNQTVDVGTGGAFQVPSLIGVSFRTPVMHSGCATTLAARFDDACGGGDRHGRTSHLEPAQIGDLVSFLETL